MADKTDKEPLKIRPDELLPPVEAERPFKTEARQLKECELRLGCIRAALEIRKPTWTARQLLTETKLIEDYVFGLDPENDAGVEAEPETAG